MVCSERQGLNPTSRYPTCGTCRSAICRLRQKDQADLQATTRRLVTLCKRIVAAQFGVAHEVVRTQFDVTKTKSRTYTSKQ